jgi:hypothetical protein
MLRASESSLRRCVSPASVARIGAPRGRGGQGNDEAGARSKARDKDAVNERRARVAAWERTHGCTTRPGIELWLLPKDGWTEGRWLGGRQGGTVSLDRAPGEVWPPPARQDEPNEACVASQWRYAFPPTPRSDYHNGFKSDPGKLLHLLAPTPPDLFLSPLGRPDAPEAPGRSSIRCVSATLPIAPLVQLSRRSLRHRDKKLTCMIKRSGDRST